MKQALTTLYCVLFAAAYLLLPRSDVLVIIGIVVLCIALIRIPPTVVEVEREVKPEAKSKEQLKRERREQEERKRRQLQREYDIYQTGVMDTLDIVAETYERDGKMLSTWTDRDRRGNAYIMIGIQDKRRDGRIVSIPYYELYQNEIIPRILIEDAPNMNIRNGHHRQDEYVDMEPPPEHWQYE